MNRGGLNASIFAPNRFIDLLDVDGVPSQESDSPIWSESLQKFQFDTFAIPSGTAMGLATPTTNPGTPSEIVYYFATTAGTYTNFSGLIISASGLYIISNKTESWTKDTIYVDDFTKVKNAIKVPNSILSSNLTSPFTNAITDEVLPIELSNIGLSRAITKTKVSNNIEIYIVISNAAYIPTINQYVRYSYYVYSSNTLTSLPVGRQRLIVFYTDSSTLYINENVVITKIKDSLFFVSGLAYIPNNGKTVSHIWFEVVLETDNALPSATKGMVTGIDIAYSSVKKFETEDGIIHSRLNSFNIDVINKNIALNSDVADGGLVDSTVRNYSANYTIADISDDILQGFGLTKYMYTVKAGSGNVELYWWFYAGVTLANEITNKFIAYNNKYCRISYYVYTKSGIMPAVQTAARLGIQANTTDGVFKFVGSDSTNGSYSITKLSTNIYKIEKIFLISFTGTLNYVICGTIWEAAIVPVDFTAGDFGITGLSMKFADAIATLSDANEIKGDWLVTPSAVNIDSAIDVKLLQADIPEKYNNLQHNLPMLSDFLIKYETKNVDENNQLTISMPGDSIFGRVDKSTFVEGNEEISLTPDANGGVGYGYTTGHFPPNMWEQNIGYKLLTSLQYPHSDVKYYNHVASEITKDGTWTTVWPVGGDCIRLARTATQNDYIQLQCDAGVTFVKFIYSTYGGNGKLRQLEFTISEDGSTFTSIADAGLTSSLTLDADSKLDLPDQDYKWGNVIIAGLDVTKTYTIRVKKADATGTLDVWGFETWTKPRINVVITAEGGNTATNQLTRWERFYSKMYNPALIIYELPYLNDLGIGIITNFKGVAILSTTPAASPTINDFWYASVTGEYTNFNGIDAIAGDYIEWNGSAWVIGNTTLDTKLATYKQDNEDVFKRLASLGCPVLTLVTHNSENWNNTRPFTFNQGLTILRSLVAKYGFASVDVNYYQMNYGYTTGIFADGTHLNDLGVTLYASLLEKVLKISYADRCVGISTAVNYRKKTGTSTGAGTISFGFEFAAIPTIRIYNNSSIVITEVTQSSFTNTGTDAFQWEAFIE